MGDAPRVDESSASSDEWSDFLSYLRSAQFADVVLKIRTVEGKTKLLPLHRIILSNRSPFFRDLFSTDPVEKNSKGVPIYEFPTVPAHPKLFVMLGQLLWWLYQTTDELIEHIPTSKKWDETLGLHHLAMILKLDRVLVLTNTRILSVVQASDSPNSKELTKITDEARKWNLPEVEKLVRTHQEALKSGTWDPMRGRSVSSDQDGSSIDDGTRSMMSASRATSVDPNMRVSHASDGAKTTSSANTAFSAAGLPTPKMGAAAKSMALRQSEALAQQVLANVELQKKVDELREAQAVLIARVSDLERENNYLLDEKEQMEQEMAQRTRGRTNGSKIGMHRSSEPHLNTMASGVSIGTTDYTDHRPYAEAGSQREGRSATRQPTGDSSHFENPYTQRNGEASGARLARGDSYVSSSSQSGGGKKHPTRSKSK
ncbi:hypothetical protein HDU93_008474, partial [Gonapodya sp. JEL0774]